MTTQEPSWRGRGPVRIGGLLRCCYASVPDRDGTVGEHIPCEHCRDPKHSGVVWIHGAWEAAWVTLGHAVEAKP